MFYDLTENLLYCHQCTNSLNYESETLKAVKLKLLNKFEEWKVLEQFAGLAIKDDNALSYSKFVRNLKEFKYKKIVVMTGAGISVSAGIPDFRSPVSGIYANLAKYNLKRPE